MTNEHVNDHEDQFDEELEEVEQFEGEEPDVDEESDEEESIVEKLIAQRDDYLDQLQRSRAEFINFRKRSEAEKLRLSEMVTASTIGKFLPVIDDWDRAMEAVPENEDDDSWVKGIKMIQGKFHQVLESSGVEEVDGVGSKFDPAIHESVATEPGSSGEVVVEVYQKGYKLGDTLLRAAMVKTGDAPQEFDA